MNIQGNAYFFGDESDAPNSKFEHYFEWLKQRQNSPSLTWPAHKVESEKIVYKRELFVNVSNDLFYGVVLSARKTHYQHYVTRSGSSVKVETRDVGKNPPVEVNCFCLKRSSNKGIYTHYYGSYAFKAFLGDLWNSYRYFVKEQLSKAESKLDGDSDSFDEDQKNLHSLYSMRGKANWNAIFSPDAFAALVKKLHVVQEVRLTTYELEAPSDAPMKRRVSNVHQTYRMNGAQTIDTSFMSWLKDKMESATRLTKKGKKSVSGSVVGENASGEEKTIFFDENIENLIDYKYDDIGTFDTANLAVNPCIELLIKKVRSEAKFT